MPLGRRLPISTIAFVPHPAPSAGVFKDVAYVAIPDDGARGLADMLCDRVGMVRKRGGTMAGSSPGSQTAMGTTIIGYQSGARDGLTALYLAGKDTTGWGAIQSVNTATGAVTSITGGSALVSGVTRLFHHLGLVISAGWGTGVTPSNYVAMLCGVQTSTSFYDLAGSGIVTAGNPVIQFSTGSPAFDLNSSVGMSVVVRDGTGSNSCSNFYIGRITRILSNSQIEVEPTPTVSFNATLAETIGLFNFPSVGSGTVYTTVGKSGCSHQNRIVWANVIRYTSGFTGTSQQAYPHRVWWSVLPDETPDATGCTLQGYVQLTYNAYSANNWLEIPTQNPLTGVVSATDGQLIVFDRSSTWRVTGELQTQTSGVTGGDTIDVHPLSMGIGCLDDRTIQKAPRGVVWADAQGVYLYDGSQIRPLMYGRVAREYADLINAGAVLQGSALCRNHYFLFTTSAQYVVNLDTLAWTQTQNLSFFAACPDPVDSSKVWGVQWWDTTGAAPTLVGGQAARVDPIFTPSSANRSDHNGAAVLPIVKTKLYPAGSPAARLRFVKLRVGYSLANCTGATVSQTMTDPSNDATYTTLGSLAQTSAATTALYSAVRNGFASGYKLALTQPADSFEVYGLEVGIQGLPETES